MNFVVQSGRLTRDPESHAVGNTTKCSFSIAVNKKYRKKDGTVAEKVTFLDCEAWDSGAETVLKYASKGSHLLVQGALENNVWEKEGKKHVKTFIRVERFEFLDKRSDNAGAGDKVSTQASAEQPVEVGASEGDQDIPF